MRDMEPKYDVINRFQYHRPAIQKSLPVLNGAFWEEDLLRGILNGQLFMFENDQAFIIVNFAVYPRFKDLNMLLSGGNIRGFLELKDDLFEFARDNDCKRVVGIGWPKWKVLQKLFPEEGWEQRVILLEKEL